MVELKPSRALRRSRQERVRRSVSQVALPFADASREARISRSWRRTFLIVLGETSDLQAACAAVRIDTDRAYAARRNEPDFAIAWRLALLEGYENLELETLSYLRTGKRLDENRPYDVVNAIRLIKGQADAAARERAGREDGDEQDVLDSIDRMLDGMRERSAANAAILEEPIDEKG